MENEYTKNIERKTAGNVNFNTTTSNSYIVNEAYKTLRTNILFAGADIKKILFTSTQENEGKSTVSTELAKNLAEIGKRTLLIDADMRKSVILRNTADSKNILGLSDLLLGNVGVESVLYTTQIPNFDVIFSGCFPSNPVDLLSSPKLSKILDDFAQEYDYVILDTPPLQPVIDAAVVSANCDGVILVITPGKVKYNEVLSVKKQILKSGSNILGVVLNETEEKYRDKDRSSKKYYYYSNNEKKRKNNK